MFIYLIENNINKKLYVGISNNPENRFLHHAKPCKRWKSIISDSINKYGREYFEIIYLEKCKNLQEAHEKEKYWIKELDCLVPNGYNLREGGEGGGSPSLETRQKISNAKKGKKRSWVTSAETRRKLSLINKGKVLSLETKERMKNSKLGNKYCLGRVLSEETKEKIRQKHLIAYHKRTRNEFGQFS